MIDYREMPFPGRPQVYSGSRLVLQIGKDYWAVELGQNLSERRKLPEGDLPARLRGESP